MLIALPPPVLALDGQRRVSAKSTVIAGLTAISTVITGCATGLAKPVLVAGQCRFHASR